jgi:hypothetical protein
MSSATIQDVLTIQGELCRRAAEGSWTIDVEDLKQPKDLTPEPAAAALHMRVVIAGGYARSDARG